jgi:hypothetical protein
MTDSPSEEVGGLLTQSERQLLGDPDADEAERDDLRDDLRERLYWALRDLSILYPTLRDEDIDAIFDPADEYRRSDVRSSIQDALGLLFLGMERSSDMIEMRVADAFASAGASLDQNVVVDIDIQREPMPPVEYSLARAERESIDSLSYHELTRLLRSPEVAAERVAAVCNRDGLQTTIAEIEEERTLETTPLQRPVQTVVTGVEIAEIDPDSAGDESQTREGR